MADEHDATWQKVKGADPAARLSYDTSALSVFLTEVRAQSVDRASAGVKGILESPTALLAAPDNVRQEREPGRWKKHWRGLTAGAGALVLAGGLTAGGIAASARTGSLTANYYSSESDFERSMDPGCSHPGSILGT